MQLVAIGAQDAYLTGNPQITFFKAVYRRHTNFSKECIEQTFSGEINATIESEAHCTLSRSGDLVQEIYFKTNVKGRPKEDTDTENNKEILASIAFDSSNTLKLSSGKDDTGAEKKLTTDNCKVDKSVYFSNYVWSSATAWETNANSTTDWQLVFSPNTEYKIKTVSGVNADGVASGVTFYNANDLSKTAINFHTSIDAKLGTSYANDNQSTDSITQSPTSVTTPFLASKLQIIISDTGNIDLNEDLTDIIKEVEIEIGGQVIDKHYGPWLDIYNELFETKHDVRNLMCRASEAIDSRNIIYIPLRFWFNRNPGLALPLIALQYNEVKINIKVDPTRGRLGEGRLSISNSKLLVNYIYLDVDERRRFAKVSHEYLIEQVQHTGIEADSIINMNFNHPVKALFWTQPYDRILSINRSMLGKVHLQLNGHERFSEQEQDFFHLVQPYESGLLHTKSLNTFTRVWGDLVRSNYTNNVGMYSFCLKPGEHQPSGTCNFSRIDSARLTINGTKNLYLFALNYNVFRVISGMGGLAYSN